MHGQCVAHKMGFTCHYATDKLKEKTNVLKFKTNVFPSQLMFFLRGEWQF